MANSEHLARVQSGVHAWNDWVAQMRLRRAPGIRHIGARIGTASFWADLSGAPLTGMDLYQGKPGAGHSGIDLIGADLRGAGLHGTNLAWANLTGATLQGCKLTSVNLSNASLHGANLEGCDLSGAFLGGTNFLMANLKNANLAGAYFYETIFADADLSNAEGLESCRYGGPCVVDHRTLLSYQPLPVAFLRGCGLPDELIALVGSRRTPTHWSCFISYSNQDSEFAEKLYFELQAKNVRCWFAPEHLPYGAKILDSIDQAVHSHDRLLVICSEASLQASWVEDEVNKAFSEERARGSDVVIPIRIDGAVMRTSKAWAAKLRDSRHIGDFTAWRDGKTFQRGFERLLRDLTIPY